MNHIITTEHCRWTYLAMHRTVAVTGGTRCLWVLGFSYRTNNLVMTHEKHAMKVSFHVLKKSQGFKNQIEPCRNSMKRSRSTIWVLSWSTNFSLTFPGITIWPIALSTASRNSSALYGTKNQRILSFPRQVENNPSYNHYSSIISCVLLLL